EHDVLLVMFYVKWCSHCRRLHPDYERAATQLSKNTDYPIHIAKFDCTNDNEAQCPARYNIDGFPTLRIYRYGQFRGEELNYLNRTTDEIIKTMKTLKKASGQQGQTQFYSYQTDGIKDEMNRATTSVQYMWLFTGLLYVSENQSSKANFIRVSSKTSAMRVKEYLIQQYDSQHPSLVISIAGSALERGLKSKLFRIFQQNLLKVARTTNTWIITDGMNTNITRFIGEIVRTNPNPSRLIHLIGIVNWQSLSDTNQFNVHGDNVYYKIAKNNQKTDLFLESNHTQFIFIDDGQQHQIGSELRFRTCFERAISIPPFSHQSPSNIINEKNSSQLQSVLIPVVLLVVEGDLGTVEQVHEAVIRNNIPVVLLEGTGKCCDLFAKVYHLYNEYHQDSKKSHKKKNDDQVLQVGQDEYIKNRIRQKVQIMLNDVNSMSSSSLIEENLTVTTKDYFELIYECIVTHKIFLNFVDFKRRNQDEPDIDLAILQAILIVTSSDISSKNIIEQKQEQLHLAMEWNRVDIVKNFIMKNEQDWKTIDLNDLFEKALIQNRIDFVQLFLDHDFQLEDFFKNTNKLLMLYKNENHSLKDDSIDPLRAIYTEIIQPLVGDSFDVNAVLSPDEISHDEHFYSVDTPYSHYITRHSKKHTYVKLSNRNSTRSKVFLSSGNTHIDVNKELFLWSVLTGKQAFALLFWTRGKNKICAALIATLLYKTKARKDKDARYNDMADEFQNLAVEILEKFYRTNPFTCTKAIIREIAEFGNMTWLHLAVMAEAKQFIAQRAVQNVLSDIWYGYIDHTVGNRMIIFSTIMLWYSGFLPYHHELVERTESIPNHDDYSHSASFIQCDASSTKYLINKALYTKRSTLTQNEDNDILHVIDGNHWQRRKINIRQYFRNILMFVHAPYVKYLYYLYSHVAFLLLFSYVILCDFFPLYDFRSNKCLSGSEENTYPDINDAPVGAQLLSDFTTTISSKTVNATIEYGLQRYNRPAASEILLTIWMFTLFCEEIRQLMSTELQSMYGKIVTYFSVFWNKLDALGITLYFIAFILRFWPTNQCFCAARIILAVDLSLWYIRILDIFAAVKRLGPKLVMIGEMVHDLTFFMLILTVFILAFGVPTYSLLFGVQQFSWHLPRAILNLAYWQIFGELEVLDEIERNYEISGYVMFVLLVAYMTVASVLLINLLIAMISNTFDRLHMDTDCIWKFQHYYLVCHHLTRPSLPPPFIVFLHIWRSTLYFFSHIIKLPWFTNQYIQHKNRAKFKIVVDEKLRSNIESIEDILGNEVCYFYLKTNRKLLDRQSDFQAERIHSPQEMVLNKMKILENQVQTITTQQDNMFEYLECLMNGLKKIGGDDIEMPKRHQFDSE
ncbi:unnamed protein product, partial [Adineta steineri]